MTHIERIHGDRMGYTESFTAAVGLPQLSYTYTSRLSCATSDSLPLLFFVRVRGAPRTLGLRTRHAAAIPRWGRTNL